MMKNRKKAQEEIVGFALIIILVSVILLIILGFSLRKPGKEAVQSYEAGSFIQTFLQYTSDCSNSIEYLSIQKLIFSCNSQETCNDERNTCDILNSTLTEIIEKSWKVSQKTPVKGYKVEIISKNSEIKQILFIKKGNETKNYESSIQSFTKNSVDYDITFTAYY